MRTVYFYDFALECDYFEWGNEEEGTDDINNGYICNHREQTETSQINPDYLNINFTLEPPLLEIVGECHCYSCPLGVPDPEDEEKILPEVEE